MEHCVFTLAMLTSTLPSEIAHDAAHQLAFATIPLFDAMGWDDEEGDEDEEEDEDDMMDWPDDEDEDDDFDDEEEDDEDF
jgi:hypothetical protein